MPQSEEKKYVIVHTFTDNSGFQIIGGVIGIYSSLEEAQKARQYLERERYGLGSCYIEMIQPK